MIARFVLLFTGLMIIASSIRASEPKVFVDYSGMEYFFEIAHLFKQDREPPEHLWDALFHSPAYRCAIETEFSKKFFKRYYRLAFKPSEKDNRVVFLYYIAFESSDFQYQFGINPCFIEYKAQKTNSFKPEDMIIEYFFNPHPRSLVFQYILPRDSYISYTRFVTSFPRAQWV